MISKKMATALNHQINAELYSSYLYLSMSAYCDAQNLKGFASWMRLQAAEENEHAMKFFDYLLSVNHAVKLDAIEKPPVEFGTPKDVFAKVLAHEQKVTALIHKLYEQAVAEKDYGTQVMLQWFISEQIEEEDTARGILEQIEAIGDKSTAIWWIDKELKKRQ